MKENLPNSYKNQDLSIQVDNKPKWNLPKYRRHGFRNLHKINKYGMFLRSQNILDLKKNYIDNINNFPSVIKLINHKSFCSLVVVRGQEILFERYANDFSENQPHTIMSITKMFMNLFVGELFKHNKIDLDKTVSYYLPKIGSGYEDASIQNVLNMNVQNLYSEDYKDPYASSYLHEELVGWRLAKGGNEGTQEEFLYSIECDVSDGVINNTNEAQYKSANTDVLGLLVEKISGRPLRQWLLETVEAVGFEEGLYMSTDKIGMPWMSSGGSLIARDLARFGLLFCRKGKGVNQNNVGSSEFINLTIKNPGPPRSKPEDFILYSNQTMISSNWIGHAGYGGQFLLINMVTGIVAAFFSVLETSSATDEVYKLNMIRMLEEVTSLEK